jgi:hypothetical protein
MIRIAVLEIHRRGAGREKKSDLSREAAAGQ